MEPVRSSALFQAGDNAGGSHKQPYFPAISQLKRFNGANYAAGAAMRARSPRCDLPFCRKGH